MKTEKRVKFGGVILENELENTNMNWCRKIFYAWNEYPRNKLIGNDSLVAQYMKVKLENNVYFVTDSLEISLFIRRGNLEKATFFKDEDIDANQFADELIERYFHFIS